MDLTDYSNSAYIILDVDRTILNGTSWFHACSCPNLIISSDNTDKFLEMNDRLFKSGKEADKTKFRELTLNLIEPMITNDFLYLINRISRFKDRFKINSFTDNSRLYAAGYYAACYLVKIDYYFLKSIQLILNNFNNNVKILFISSGYMPFIQGVVDFINQQYNICKSPLVIGTNIECKNGKIFIKGNIMCQQEKTNILRKIIQKNGKIVFLADDSYEDPKLFNLVKENGGMAFKVEHNNGNSNWELLYSIISSSNIKNYLLNNCNKISLKKVKTYGCFANWIEQHINKIGILTLKRREFKSLLNNISRQIGDTSGQLNKLLKNFIFYKKSTVYLRGLLFYYWLPPYITQSVDTKYVRWCQFLDKTQILIGYLINIAKSNKINILSFEYKLILYIALDHLFECLLFGMNILEKDSIKTNTTNNKEFATMDFLIQKTSDLIIKIYSDKYYEYQDLELLYNRIYYIDKSNYKSINYSKQFMKELDNILSIYKSAYHVASTSKYKNINFDYVLVLSYGGISLGYVLKSVMKEIFFCKSLPELISCHFSCKKHRLDDSNKNFWNSIPNYYQHNKCILNKSSKSILIFDNNVTTFDTLQECSKQLQKKGHSTYCATVGINYDNLRNFFSFLSNSEPLNENWNHLLDFHPVEEYITAFNTWNTSEKSTILEKIYFSPIQNEIKTPFNTQKPQNMFQYKVCRVHNLYDLFLASNVGATMIGIHAVYKNKIEYYNGEEYYKPILKENFNNYPVTNYEVNGIRNMMIHMPKSIKPVVVFENKIDIKSMLKCLEIYGVDPGSAGVQLQYFVKKEELIEIKKHISFVIISVGIQQKNIEAYLNELIMYLNFAKDFVLLDLSKHQPNLLNSHNKQNIDTNMKFTILKKISPVFKKIPLLIADDTDPNTMLNYLTILNKLNIEVKGFDMQNVTELEKSFQRYQLIKTLNSMYQIKIRKSVDKLGLWKDIISTLREEDL